MLTFLHDAVIIYGLETFDRADFSLILEKGKIRSFNMSCKKFLSFEVFGRKGNRAIALLLCLLMVLSGGFGFFSDGLTPLTGWADEMEITTQNLAWATAGEDYSQSISVTGGTSPYTFSLAPESRELPEGLELSAAGVISGIPTESGAFFNIVIAVQDSTGMIAKKRYRLNVDAFVINFEISDNIQYYDGTPKTLTATPINSPEPLQQGVDYTVLYSGMKQAVEARRYGVRIIFSNPKYTCGDIDNRLFKILPSPDCDIELADKTVEHTGAPQSLEPNITPLGLSCVIHYEGKDGTVYSKSETPPSDPGTYLVTAKITDKNYESKEASATLKIKGIPLTFAVENNEVEYLRGMAQKAKVTPSVATLAEGTDYAITYDDISTAGIENFDGVENVGTYKINIKMKNASYDIDDIVLPNMTVYSKKVDFVASNTSAYYDETQPGTEYSANPVPNDNAIREDKYNGGVHDGSGDYYIVYKTSGDPAVMREGSVTRPGEYGIEAVFNNPNYSLGTLDHDTFSLSERSKISFAISDNNYEYSEGIQRKAKVVPLAPYADFTDYTVTYDYTTTPDIEKDESAEEAGKYVIRIALGDDSISKGYAIKNPTPGFLIISRNRVDFNADKVEFLFDPADPSGVYQPKLTMQEPDAYPSLVEGRDYEFYYSSVSGGQQFKKITKPGRYNALVRFLGGSYRNYIMGDVRPRATFNVRSKGWIELEPGDSIAGMIMRQPWDEQKKKDTLDAVKNSGVDGIYSSDSYIPGFHGIGLNSRAWSDYGDVNLDFDPSTVFIENLDELGGFISPPGEFKAFDSDNTPVDPSKVTIKIKKFRTVAKSDSTFPATLANALRWTSPQIISEKLNTGEHGDKLVEKDYVLSIDQVQSLLLSGVKPVIGVYDLEYSFNDKDGNEVKAVRKVVYLGHRRDINMDGNVNDADAYRLRLWKSAAGDGAPAGVAALHYFRGCDDSGDGKIIADPANNDYEYYDDASRILNRFRKL